MDILSKTMKQLEKENIPIDDYYKLMNYADAQDIEVEESEDAAQDFKKLILEMNEQEILPTFFSEYCKRYGVDHNDPGIEPDLSYTIDFM